MTVQMRLLETDKDTICALATAHGTGAISIVRVSGARAVEVTRKIAAFLPPPDKLESHKIYYGYLHSLEGGEPIDEVLVSYFAEGKSFSGEASFEISCHGSEILVNEILRNLVLAGARPANRGEFTYRAFMSGRIDLVQAESVLSLIESGSKRAAQQALRQLKGAFSVQIKAILDDLTWVLAHLEADIDFAAEDIEVAGTTVLGVKTQSALESVRVLMSGYRQGVIIRDGFHVALVGPPNAGKSSLLNALAGEERAIVTPVAGTTRDFVEARMSEAGVSLTVIDTAGLRVTDDPVERIGVARTLEKMKDVDLVMYVADATAPQLENEFFSAIPWEKTALLVNKIDLNSTTDVEPRGLATLKISASTGEGLRELRTWLKARLRKEIGEDSTLVSNARHYQGLETVANCLENALPLMLNGGSPDLVALELQAGLRALYEILGMVFDDQVMDRVFSEFCLGK